MVNGRQRPNKKAKTPAARLGFAGVWLGFALGECAQLLQPAMPWAKPLRLSAKILADESGFADAVFNGEAEALVFTTTNSIRKPNRR